MLMLTETFNLKRTCGIFVRPAAAAMRLCTCLPYNANFDPDLVYHAVPVPNTVEHETTMASRSCSDTAAPHALHSPKPSRILFQT